MSSVGPTSRGFKQAQGGFFVNIVAAGLNGKILSYNGTTGAGGSSVNGSFSTATWAQVGSAGASKHTSTLTLAGSVLRDMGKSVVSSGRLFRKVQLLVSTVSTGGVDGTSGNSYPATDYLTGYIELPNAAGGGGMALPAPVAYLPSVAF
jgi:hypothetical protein